MSHNTSSGLSQQLQKFLSHKKLSSQRGQANCITQPLAIPLSHHPQAVLAKKTKKKNKKT